MVNVLRLSAWRIVASGICLLSFAASAEANSIQSRLTRKDDMNAVRHLGQAWTIHDLFEHRAKAPGRFDSNNQRLGSALRLGLDGLEARRELNPSRFDFYHPFLGYLLADSGGNPSGLGNLGVPDEMPPIVGTDGSIDMPPSDGGPSPQQPTSPEPPMLLQEPSPPNGPAPIANGDLPPTVPGLDLPPAPNGPEGPRVHTPGDGPTGGPLPGDGPGDLGGQAPQGPTQVIPEPPGMVQLSVGLLGLVGLLAWRGSRRGRIAAA
jgi:hypothetical protein